MGRLRMSKLTPEERSEFARSGGKVGGKARAASLTLERRREIGRKGAAIRCGKKQGKKAGVKEAK